MAVRRKVFGLILTCIGFGVLLALLLPPIGWVLCIGIGLVIGGIYCLKKDY